MLWLYLTHALHTKKTFLCVWVCVCYLVYMRPCVFAPLHFHLVSMFFQFLNDFQSSLNICYLGVVLYVHPIIQMKSFFSRQPEKSNARKRRTITESANFIALKLLCNYQPLELTSCQQFFDTNIGKVCFYVDFFHDSIVNQWKATYTIPFSK